MVGFLGYDAVRRLERLPDTTTDDLGLPELTFLFATDLAALDHETGEIWLIANAVNWDDSDERVDEAWADAVGRLDAMQADHRRTRPRRTSCMPTGRRGSSRSGSGRVPSTARRSSMRRRRSGR